MSCDPCANPWSGIITWPPGYPDHQRNAHTCQKRGSCLGHRSNVSLSKWDPTQASLSLLTKFRESLAVIFMPVGTFRTGRPLRAILGMTGIHVVVDVIPPFATKRFIQPSQSLNNLQLLCFQQINQCPVRLETPVKPTIFSLKAFHSVLCWNMPCLPYNIRDLRNLQVVVCVFRGRWLFKHQITSP